MLFVAAAGNDGRNNDAWDYYPSGYDVPNVISVASTDRFDLRSSFSNYGRNSVDLGAPGSDIFSTIRNGRYDSLSGTSMATPHVAGVAALVRAFNPHLSSLEIKALILNNVDPIESMASITTSGGRLNAHEVLQSALPEWVSIESSTAGTLLPNESREVEILLDSSDLVAGKYHASLVMSVKTPHKTGVEVPITLSVGSAGLSGSSVLLPPTNLRVESDTFSSVIQIGWDSVSGATDYLVRRTEQIGADMTELGTTNGLSFEDRSSATDQVYYYQVSAVFDQDTGPPSAFVAASRTESSADISIQLVSANQEINFGDTVVYQLSYTNGGPDEVMAARLSYRVPGNARFVSATVEGGNCDEEDLTVVCRVGTLSNGQSKGIQIQVEPLREGSVISSFSGVADFSDPIDTNPVNNVIEVITDVVSDADLVAGIGSANGIFSRITNLGPSSANGVIVDYSVTDNSVVQVLSDSGACIAHAGLTRCDVGIVESGLTVNARILVDPSSVSALTVTSFADNDKNVHNDVATLSLSALDSDGDGLSNPLDDDDDGDGMTDVFELEHNLDPLLDDSAVDQDGDGATNLEEFLTKTDPRNSASVDACFSNSAIADDPASSSLTSQSRLYVANPGSNINQQTFLRFVNDNEEPTTVEMYGIDDKGQQSVKAAISFTLEAFAAKQINAQDIESGNSFKGIASNLCDGDGKWQMIVRSNNPIRVLSLIRTPDGFLTSLNDVVPKSGNDNLVFFANPASNLNQQTFLRVVNKTAQTGDVVISAIDDAGNPAPQGQVSFTLGPNESKQMTSQHLENGSSAKGLVGSLGDGVGKWRLVVSSLLEIETMSLIRTTDGFLTNLSGVVEQGVNGHYHVYFTNAASEPSRQTFLRIINVTDQVGGVTISAIDDDGNAAPSGQVMFTLGPRESKQMTSQHLENGSLDKGLGGMLGDGTGRWRLTVEADVDIKVMSLVRTPDGFLTNLSRVAPKNGNTISVFIFNPGSNTNQVSSLRIVNTEDVAASVSISGVDDSGQESTGSVSLSIPANQVIEVSSQDLENGNQELGLTGSLGDGSGKWQLKLVSDSNIEVQSLMLTPTGFLTNLSNPAE